MKFLRRAAWQGALIMGIILLTSGAFGATFTQDRAIVSISDMNPLEASAIMLEKDGEKTYFYIERANINIPLSMGSGDYILKLLKHREENSYYVLETKYFKVSDDSNLFISSAQPVEWNTDDAAIIKARTLTAGIRSDYLKTKRIYDYIVGNIKYDFNKINYLNYTYVPDISDTFKTNKGICYDYASLFAAMNRSVGVPTRLVKGYAIEQEEYHAWNEVKMGNHWYIVDTTFDAAYVQAGRRAMPFKMRENYDVKGKY